MRMSLIVLSALALLLAGCARDVETRVTQFHEGVLPAGETFVVRPIDPAKRGPEFNQYAGLIADQMVRYGFRPVDEGEPDLAVEIDYSVSEGRTKVESRPGFVYPYYSYHLGFFHPHHHAFFYPHYYGGYFGPEIRTETVFSRSLVLRIRDLTEDQVVFEGRAVSEGPTQEISAIMPYLVESMFRHFPGESGTTKLVEIETENGKRY